MKTGNKERKSVCVSCGVRLSTRTPDGEIKWQPSQVDDVGLYCTICFERLDKEKGRNKARKTTRQK